MFINFNIGMICGRMFIVSFFNFKKGKFCFIEKFEFVRVNVVDIVKKILVIVYIFGCKFFVFNN